MRQPNWFRDAVFYEVLLGSYADSNNDGIGDFSGLTGKLDYLQWLGIGALWVPPFYPSPLKDGGYDVADYLDVAARYGTLEDFDQFTAEAHDRGIRIVIDMVLNHTSSEHQWFQASRNDSAGPYGDYYVWSDDPTVYADARIIFTDTETSNWTWDEQRGQYYWHRFFSHQPDLNFENPRVREELLNVVRFWCERGVDGLRLDAIPYLYEAEGTNCENDPRTHDFIADLRAMLDREYPGVILIAEANQPPEEVLEFFGTDERPECQVCFHFPLMPQIFLSLRTGDASGVWQCWEDTPIPPAGGDWGLFLRNHDELTLEMVTDQQRELMFDWYAPDPQMRANVGIGRRLAPLLGGARDELELAHGLLLSVPGVPFLYYGDEIGMGDRVDLPDRDGVRTPMQWDGSEGAGFSEAGVNEFFQPLVVNPGYSPAECNVASQMADQDSWLHWLRNLLGVRSSCSSLQEGDFALTEIQVESVFAFIRSSGIETTFCAFNFAPSEVTFTLPEEVQLSPNIDPAIRAGAGTIDGQQMTLPARGFVWLALV